MDTNIMNAGIDDLDMSHVTSNDRVMSDVTEPTPETSATLEVNADTGTINLDDNKTPESIVTTEDENKEGEEVENKEEEADERSDVEVFLTHLSENKGLELTDSELQEFSDIASKNFSDEGVLADFVDKVVKINSTKSTEGFINKLSTQYPDVIDYLNYRSKGGDKSSYFELRSATTDYSSIEIATTNQEQHIQIIADEYQTINNMTREKAMQIAKYDVESAGAKSNELAEASKNNLIKHNNNIIAQDNAKVEEQFQQQQAQIQRERQGIVNKVNEGRLDIKTAEGMTNSYAIPKEHREELAAALITPYRDKGGNYFDKSGKNLGTEIPSSKINDLASIADAHRLMAGQDAKILTAYFYMYNGVNKMVDNQVANKTLDRIRNLKVNLKPKNNSEPIKETNAGNYSVNSSTVIGDGAVI